MSALIFILLLNITLTICNDDVSKRTVRDLGPQQGNPLDQYKAAAKSKPDSSSREHYVDIKLQKDEQPAIKAPANITSSAPAKKQPTATANASTEATNHGSFTKNVKGAEMESGALLRGVLVFVGISVLFMIYLAIKTYRRKNARTNIVRKYGVRARRSDVEMTPLPLEEDEDDETVFDVGNVNR